MYIFSMEKVSNRSVPRVRIRMVDFHGRESTAETNSKVKSWTGLRRVLSPLSVPNFHFRSGRDSEGICLNDSIYHGASWTCFSLEIFLDQRSFKACYPTDMTLNKNWEDVFETSIESFKLTKNIAINFAETNVWSVKYHKLKKLISVSTTNYWV